MYPPNFKTWLTSVAVAVIVLGLVLLLSAFSLSDFIGGRVFKPVEYADGPVYVEEEPEPSYAASTRSPQASNRPVDPPPPVRETNYSVTSTQDIFIEVFGRWPSRSESEYWERRRADKPSDEGIKGAMQYYLSRHPESAQSNRIKVSSSDIESLFIRVWGRKPTASEKQYWTSRIADKPTKEDMMGAMQYHFTLGINH